MIDIMNSPRSSLNLHLRDFKKLHRYLLQERAEIRKITEALS